MLEDGGLWGRGRWMRGGWSCHGSYIVASVGCDDCDIVFVADVCVGGVVFIYGGGVQYWGVLWKQITMFRVSFYLYCP